MSCEPTSFTCPTCAATPLTVGNNAQCPNCGDSFTLLHHQNCPGCGLTLKSSNPATHCPDCDETLPAAHAVWQYSELNERCPACRHKLNLHSQGTRKCEHCGFTRSFNHSKQSWEETMRPFLCSCCGQIITCSRSSTTCPNCRQQFQLNTTQGYWEEIPTYIDFHCPACGQRHAIPLRAEQISCARCGLSYTRPDSLHTNWTCNTEPGTCPICESNMERSPDGTTTTCPRCKYANTFDPASSKWKPHYRQLQCFCGEIITQHQNPNRCPKCQRHYRFNKTHAKWEEYEPEPPKATRRAVPTRSPQSGKKEPSARKAQATKPAGKKAPKRILTPHKKLPLPKYIQKKGIPWHQIEAFFMTLLAIVSLGLMLLALVLSTCSQL